MTGTDGAALNSWHARLPSRGPVRTAHAPDLPGMASYSPRGAAEVCSIIASRRALKVLKGKPVVYSNN